MKARTFSHSALCLHATANASASSTKSSTKSAIISPLPLNSNAVSSSPTDSITAVAATTLWSSFEPRALKYDVTMYIIENASKT